MSVVSQPEPRTSDGRFAKGNPGGPGRPRKIMKAVADALDERVAKAAPELFNLAFDQARSGSPAAVKMLLDRVWPVGRGRPLEITLQPVTSPRDLLPAAAELSSAVLAGEASGREGADVARVLKAYMEAVELFDHERRITELEEVDRTRK